MLIIIAIFLVYLLSFIAFWNYVRISHSKDGQWYNTKPDFADVVLSLIPILNTGFAILSWFMFSPWKDKTRGIPYRLNRLAVAFFNIKK